MCYESSSSPARAGHSALQLQRSIPRRAGGFDLRLQGRSVDPLFFRNRSPQSSALSPRKRGLFSRASAWSFAFRALPTLVFCGERTVRTRTHGQEAHAKRRTMESITAKGTFPWHRRPHQSGDAFYLAASRTPTCHTLGQEVGISVLRTP